jgi:ABC-type transport system involved in Fe-S cluster assembly fused permease/ATPase subunit
MLVAKTFAHSSAVSHQSSGQTTQTGGVSGNQNKFGKMNRTVFIITMLFIVFTLPLACASFFFNTLFASDWGYFLINLLDCISFTYHASDFVISYLSNTIFRAEVNRLFNKQAAHEVSQTGSTMPTRTPKPN